MGHVQATWWGAVVTAPAFPVVWDANYARVDAAAPDLRLADILEASLPSLRRAGTDVFHVVSFHPEETTGLLTELSSLGHALTWDVVMDHTPGRSIVPPVTTVEELAPDTALWERVHASLELFGVAPDVATQLRALEEVAQPATAKRWFGVRDEDGVVVSMAALVLLDEVGYLDHVVTFPQARGRGLATALAAHAIAEARTNGARHVSLFADPDDQPVLRMYERLGFRETGRLPSTRGPIGSLT